MPSRVQAERTTSRRTSPEEEVQSTNPAKAAAKAADLKSEMDEVLADIDDVLEKNAEEFVAGYVQRGGE